MKLISLLKSLRTIKNVTRDYTRILYPNENQSTVNEKGHFKAVCDATEKEVISLSNVV